MLHVPQDVPGAKVRTQPHVRGRTEVRRRLPADGGRRQPFIWRELANCGGQFLIVGLEPAVQAGARP